MLALLVFLYQVRDVLVNVGTSETERQVLQFYLNGVKAQSVSQRCIEEIGLAGYLHLLVRTHGVQRAHIVQAVCQFYENGSYVIVNGVKHLLEIVKLL